jgi:hypothetical protein
MFGKDFFDTPRTRVSTSGGPVDLPVLYRDVSVRHFLFMVDRARPFAVEAADVFASRLNPAQVLAPWPAPPLPYGD